MKSKLPDNTSLNSSFSLCDIGVNLMNSAFDRDRETVIDSAVAAGVTTLIITGSSIESSSEASAFAQTHEHCFSTAGVHPHNAKNWDGAERLRTLAMGEPAQLNQRSVIVAIGECGLDYNRNFSPPEAQRKCFEEQLALAAQLQKPVFLHERDAFGDFLAILKNYRASLPGVVVHCFTGGIAELEAYLTLDCHIGITGWISDERRGSHLIPLLRLIPPERLLLETDAPYLLPRTMPRPIPQATTVRGKSGRNEPRFLSYIAAFAADILETTPDDIAAQTSANAARLFNLPTATLTDTAHRYQAESPL